MKTSVPCVLCGDASEFFATTDDSFFGSLDYFQCRSCKLIVQDPSKRLSAEDEKKRYEMHDNNPSDPGYRDFLSRLISPLCAHLIPGMTGLDFGCGPGPAIKKLLEPSNCDVKEYDPYFYPDENLLNDQYDFITATEVLEHLSDPMQTLRRIDSLLKSGGFFGAMTSLYTDRIRFDEWWYPKDPTHVVFYHPDTMKAISGIFGWEYSIHSENSIIFKKN